MGIRIGLALCLTAGCTLLGKSAGNAARRRSKCLEDMIRAVRLLDTHITDRCCNVSDSLMKTGYEPFVQSGAEMKNGFSAGEAWARIRQAFYGRRGILDALIARDREIVNELFDGLGGSSRQAQEVLIDSAVRYLSEQHEGARLQLAEKDRLYVTVGFLFGLILALAVI